ncbi:hypothetical protein CLHUN_28700 [Ruminiclostridium hungatei]|uniref:Uncharacterized protein n=1 Tax=Ruminiclostridium hungatei TaxID=48256 RepID=A0A1V4SHB2_RUMHU|nr:DUF6512 family protein [Ruminiclostridium hungatei]OPX43322.1 hypothetical protein CLHUN_28700 [Ruminiclostridium hungatei]
MIRNLSLKKWLYISIPVLFVIGTCFHFLYELSGESPAVGAMAAVNESVWEHSKMLLLPILGWWFIFYITKGKKHGLDPRKWFSGMLVSVVAAILTTFLVFYFYTRAFGVECLVVDILLLLLSDAVGQLLGFHVYEYSKGIRVSLSAAAALLLMVVYIVWTFNPPHLPLFLDEASGKYGIQPKSTAFSAYSPAPFILIHQLVNMLVKFLD